jgi:hypothetical protein
MAIEQSQATGAIGGAAQGAATGAVFGAPGAIVGGIVGGIGGFLSGGGEKAAKKAAKNEARQILRAARENQRVQTRIADEQVSLSKARTYASNLIDMGSTKKYRDSLESEYRRNIDFGFESALTNANTATRGGTTAANAISRAGTGQMIGGLTSLGTAYGAGAFNKPKPDASSLGYAQAGSGGNYTTSSPASSLLTRKVNP